MEFLERAKKLLYEEQATCVIVLEGEVILSKERGIRPVLEQLELAPEKLKGASVADKVIGKSAALLFTYAGIQEIYSEIISEYAISVFQKHGISCSYGKRVPYIINREGNGMCPMEQAVLETEVPEIAYSILVNKQRLTDAPLQELQSDSCSI